MSRHQRYIIKITLKKLIKINGFLKLNQKINLAINISALKEPRIGHGLGKTI